MATKKQGNELTVLRQKDLKTLQQELKEQQTNLQKARVDVAFGRLTKTSTVTALRKKIAKTLTIMNEKQGKE